MHRNFRRIISLTAMGILSCAWADASQAFSNAPPEMPGAGLDAKTLYLRARQYAQGEGFSRDYAKAAEYMQLSAEKGFALAQNDLGVYYAKGVGVAQDYREAAKWYRKAAEQGDPLAQYSLGKSLQEGRGVPTNVVEAINWYKKAADQNQPDALLALGYLYFEPHEGVPVDWREAKRYFQQAFVQGRAGALNPVGFMYEHGGPHIDVDPVEALKCYRLAAEKNDAEAEMNLGRIYFEGTGVLRDYQEAYKWLYLARANGSPIANHYLRQLDGQNPLNKPLLTTDQIQNATDEAKRILRAMRKQAPK
jgi:TPR repeat protein